MKKRIEQEEVRYIAHLARLQLSKEEEIKFARQLGKILEYVEKLKEVDVSDTAPTFHVLPLFNVWRKDKTGVSLSQEDALSNAPAKRRGHFQVPRVI